MKTYDESFIGKRIDQAAEKYADKIFLRYEDRLYTFGKLNESVDRFLNGLYEMGVGQGDKVALLSQNNDFFVICLLAILKLGAVAVPINVHQRGSGLKYIINQCDSKLLIYTKEHHHKLMEIKEELLNLQKVLIFDLSDEADDWDIPCFNGEDLLNCSPFGRIYDYPNIRPTDMCEIIYTSGTTGPPKGVVWTHRKFDSTVASSINFTNSDTMYTCLPLFHGLAQTMLFMCLFSGASLVLASKFSASNFWSDIDRYKATWFNYIGGIIPILLKQSESMEDKHHTARFCFGCGAPQDPSIWRAFESRFNVKIMEYYGSTEVGTVTLGTRSGSIGRVRNSYSVKIVNGNGKECKPNGIGELWVKAKNSDVFFQGYYKMPEETLEKTDDGWFKSGDLCYRDEEGFLYFVGRKSESMRRRGENISPWEIETIVNSHSLVQECAAVPVPAEIGEDDVKICVVLQDGIHLPYQELLKYCEERMAHYLVPRYIEYKQYLPKTPTEKVERIKLKQEGVTENTWDREKEGYKIKR